MVMRPQSYGQGSGQRIKPPSYKGPPPINMQPKVVPGAGGMKQQQGSNGFSPGAGGGGGGGGGAGEKGGKAGTEFVGKKSDANSGLTKTAFNKDPMTYLNFLNKSNGLTSDPNNAFAQYNANVNQQMIDEYDKQKMNNTDMNFVGFMGKNYGNSKLYGSKSDVKGEGKGKGGGQQGNNQQGNQGAKMAAKQAADEKKKKGKGGKGQNPQYQGPSSPAGQERGVNAAAYGQQAANRFYRDTIQARGVDTQGYGTGPTRWAAF